MSTPTRPATSAVRHILIIAFDAARVVDEQRHLIAELLRRRHRVTCLLPSCAPAEAEALSHLHAEVAVVPALADASRGFISGFSARRTLALRLVTLRPQSALILDDVDATGLSTALIRAGADRIAIAPGDLPITAAGTGDEVKTAAMRQARLRLRHATAVLVEHSHEALILRHLGVVPTTAALRVGPLAAVDCRVPAPPLPASPPTRLLVWAGRQGDNGAADAVAAVRHAAAERLELVIGGPHARALRLDGVKATVLPLVTSLEDAVAAAHVVLVAARSPGLPPLINAALSTGRAIIAPSVRGARLAVDDGVNGMLVPTADPTALAAAVGAVARRPDLAAMGRASRAKAERWFEAGNVVSGVCDALGLPAVRAGAPAKAIAA